MKPIVSTTAFELDRLIRSLVAIQRGMTARIAQAAYDVVTDSSWLSLGFRNSDDFAREELRINARVLRRMAALHRAARACPGFALAIEGKDGATALGRAAAFELSSVITPSNTHDWITRARDVPVRELRGLIRAAREMPTESAAPPLPAESAAPQEQQRLSSAAQETNPSPSASSNVSSRNAHEHPPARDEIEAQAPVALRFMAPPETHLALNEAMDVHGAVVGQNLGTTAFVEAFVGEAVSSGVDPALTGLPARESGETERVSRDTAGAGQATTSSVRLNHARMATRQALFTRHATVSTPRGSTKSMRRALEILACMDETFALEKHAAVAAASNSGRNRPQARARVNALKQVIHLDGVIEGCIAQLLVDLRSTVRWESIGFTGLAHYAAERVGWSSAETHRRVRLADGLRSLPAVSASYDRGRLGVEAATWVVRNIRRSETSERVALQTQRTWARHAATTTVKRLRDEDRMLKRAELLHRGAVAQEVTRACAGPPSSALTKAPIGQSGRRCPAPAADDSAQFHTGIPTDLAWRFSIARSPGEGRDRVLALGSQLVERVSLRGAMATLPVKLVLSQELAESLWSCIESVRRDLMTRASLINGQPAAVDARLTPAERIARGLHGRGQPIPHWVAFHCLLEQFLVTWDDPAGMPRRPLDAIHSRDGWRCGAPGCTQRRNLQIHHLEHRAQGGSDAAWNLQELCSFHHLQGEHGDFARVRGRAPLDVVWRLGTAELGTWYRNERRLLAGVDAMSKP